MNKLIFTGLVLATVVLSSCSTTSKYMTAESFGLKGNVKATTDLFYIAHVDDQNEGQWIKGDLAEGRANTHQKLHFDEQGKHFKQEFITHKIEVRATYLLEWDKERKTVLRDKYLHNGEIIFVGEHSYPSKDSVIVNTHGGYDSMVTQQFRSKIDRKGREIACKFYNLDEDGEINYVVDMSTKYKRDLKIEFLYKYRSPGYPDHHYKYTYLKFDQYGNWIKALQRDLDQSEDYIIERKIEYYN